MIHVSAKSENEAGKNKITLTTMDRSQSIDVASKASGFGSVVNGGEFLMLAVATCYSNDLYREAKKMDIAVKSVEVEVFGVAEAVAGAPVDEIRCEVKVIADASSEEIQELIRHTDTVAEIPNTLRKSTPVSIEKVEVVKG